MPIDLAFLHGRLAFTLVLYFFLCAAWGLAAYQRGGGVSGAYLGALAIGVAALVAQALVGVALVIMGAQPASWLHIAYGTLAAVSLPVAHGFARRRASRRALLIYALAALWVFGLTVRALTTGR